MDQKQYVLCDMLLGVPSEKTLACTESVLFRQKITDKTGKFYLAPLSSGEQFQWNLFQVMLLIPWETAFSALQIIFCIMWRSKIRSKYKQSDMLDMLFKRRLPHALHPLTCFSSLKRGEFILEAFSFGCLAKRQKSFVLVELDQIFIYLCFHLSR